MAPGLADPTLFVQDPRALAALRREAETDGKGAAKKVAREFESLFLGILLKSMRAGSTGQGGPFDNEATRLYRELGDQQLARALVTSGKGLGLAEVLASQLQRRPAAPPEQPAAPIPLRRAAEPIALTRGPAAIPFKAGLPGSDLMPLRPEPLPAAGAEPSARRFVSAVWDHAVAAGRALNVPPAFLVAQAALESGWGRRDIRLPDGSPSHNLFGIKAGPEWTGRVAEATTTEYVNGRPETRVARFRAYASYAEAFADYARLLQSSPRYAAVRGATDFASFAAALQQAGYATDPAYASKLNRVMASAAFREAWA